MRRQRRYQVMWGHTNADGDSTATVAAKDEILDEAQIRAAILAILDAMGVQGAKNKLVAAAKFFDSDAEQCVINYFLHHHGLITVWVQPYRNHRLIKSFFMDVYSQYQESPKLVVSRGVS